MLPMLLQTNLQLSSFLYAVIPSLVLTVGCSMIPIWKTNVSFLHISLFLFSFHYW